MSMPDPGIAPMVEGAIIYAEIVRSFQAAGFSRQEAMQFGLKQFEIIQQETIREAREKKAEED